ncbi:C2 domain protein [Ancylostoma caninum]|uniref:C2 domain protein n=1 Tax=Ancylostoma caninum TaxID=29170 RepID=A0A368GWQ8_ANCCA|nr:C2 domain protein [Ancylostoma caninum]
MDTFASATVRERNCEWAAIDSYVNVDWDEYHVGKTLVRPKTNEPRWNEEFIANDVHSGRAIGFTVFHNCVMPPDDFVANTRIPFDDLKIGSCNDIWVSGRIRGFPLIDYLITWLL